jgi:hypothetical protein
MLHGLTRATRPDSDGPDATEATSTGKPELRSVVETNYKMS